ncbi:MalY/PatB family protein [Bifidobacterium parmae]|nr:aminotransferase class I/II-fold pyridoxal phosphate-dependent enzyme [Bifidobacterium parmae]
MSMNGTIIDDTTITTTAPAFDAAAIDALTADDLARIGSDKWTRFPGAIGAFIAEMDFGLAPCIARAIADAATRGATGYLSDPLKREVARACAAWQLRYDWTVDPTVIRTVPDVMEAYEVFLNEIVGEGRSIVVPTPAYMPFLSVPGLCGVDVIEIPMLRCGANDGDGAGWLFDFDAIERAFAGGCRAFVLCNPHNPIGKVLTRDEMLRLSELADRYGVRVFSDEIHAPFVYEGARHVPFASISERTAMQAFTATSASKAFNIAGTKCAQVILTNPTDMAMWIRDAEMSEHQTATIGAYAAVAAYDGGSAWLDGVLDYLKGNFDVVDGEMRGRFAAVRYARPQGTYIAWLDFSPLGLDDPAGYFLERAHVALTDGRECGEAGRGCVRFNVAMPRPLLHEAFARMAAALEEDGLI